LRWVARELFFQVRVARVQSEIDDFVRRRTKPSRHDVLALGREAPRVGVAMAGTAQKTIAVGWRTCIDVMLAQTGSPARASPQIVGIL